MFPKMGVPQNGSFIMEPPIKMEDLGVPLFSETSNIVDKCCQTNVPMFIYMLWFYHVLCCSSTILDKIICHISGKPTGEEVQKEKHVNNKKTTRTMEGSALGGWLNPRNSTKVLLMTRFLTFFWFLAGIPWGCSLLVSSMFLPIFLLVGLVQKNQQDNGLLFVH